METANFIVRFLSDVTSIYWWVSVVIVGLLINLAAAYLKSPLDSWLARWSKKRANAHSEKQIKYEQELEKLMCNPELISITGFEDLRYRSRAIVFLFLAIVFAGQGILILGMKPELRTLGFPLIFSLVTTFMGLLCLVLFISSINEAVRLTKLLNVVRELKKSDQVTNR